MYWILGVCLRIDRDRRKRKWSVTLSDTCLNQPLLLLLAYCQFSRSIKYAMFGPTSTHVKCDSPLSSGGKLVTKTSVTLSETNWCFQHTPILVLANLIRHLSNWSHDIKINNKDFRHSWWNTDCVLSKTSATAGVGRRYVSCSVVSTFKTV